MFFTPQLITGLTIMAIGLALVLDKLGLVHARDVFQFWPALLVVFGAAVIAESFRKPDPSAPATVGRRRGGAPCFFAFIIVMALLGTYRFEGRAAERVDADNRVNVTGIMGAADSKPEAGTFRNGQVSTVMGRSTLDLRSVTLAPGEQAVVDVFVTMGRATIRVPDGWTVDTSAIPVMGTVEDNRWSSTPQGDTTAGPKPRLVVRGFVMMGKVEITG
jgi:hypothetical protein